ncbi:hypothetical protein JB92DRAFT_3039020 [Gautieria morchelliformis]|nr:hypothetical protein JB92DRAFT_3039020 [Gautieria morchelliformis]
MGSRAWSLVLPSVVTTTLSLSLTTITESLIVVSQPWPVPSPWSVPSATTPLTALPPVISTIVSAPQATHGPSAILIGAVLGGIRFLLVCLILCSSSDAVAMRLYFLRRPRHIQAAGDGMLWVVSSTTTSGGHHTFRST